MIGLGAVGGGWWEDAKATVVLLAFSVVAALVGYWFFRYVAPVPTPTEQQEGS